MAYGLPFGEGVKNACPVPIDIPCPVCRDEMEESDERCCEECGNTCCWGCVVPFDKDDQPMRSHRGASYFVCSRCCKKLNLQVLVRGAGIYTAGVPCGSVTPAPLQMEASR